jgi:hypothetical protein
MPKFLQTKKMIDFNYCFNIYKKWKAQVAGVFKWPLFA